MASDIPKLGYSSGGIKKQIEDAIKREIGSSAAKVKVKVTDDAIELSGTVESQIDYAAVKRIANSLAEGRQLVNGLTIFRRLG